MKTIEEAIQSRFRNEKHKALVNILYTAKFIENKVQTHIKPYKITMQQYNILRIVRGAGGKPVSLKYIKERMLDKMPDASRIVDKLYKKGLLKRKECPNDRRSVDITITNKGLELLETMDKQAQELDDICQNLSDTQLQELNYLLNFLRNE
ncbi:MarR family winged helix-turn-helix transcriptional regulator [Raineya orbicola]|jgi:DNA-binding MarR family transcriptional regulator|uniref:MarR family n=1 Tax=Raineya orbicola TaxID=2016530 RepID=A0A2N3IHP1_9BACT|nr:MarR family transcriptional regulator [Raineya orbicola]PKQ69768.1 MarR family [Raineya orbicola]